jgi:hypothetical protein
MTIYTTHSQSILVRWNTECIVISVLLQVSGAVFVDVLTVQNFTDYIYLGRDPCEAKQINRVAKTFYAVARAVRT